MAVEVVSRPCVQYEYQVLVLPCIDYVWSLSSCRCMQMQTA